jgi:hypothetical protein
LTATTQQSLDYNEWDTNGFSYLHDKRQHQKCSQESEKEFLLQIDKSTFGLEEKTIHTFPVSLAAK